VRTRRRRVLSGVSRVAVTEALREAGHPLSVSELAGLVGLHTNTVRWHLDHLAGEGRVERVAETAGRPGRPRLLYTLRPLANGVPPAERLADAAEPAHGYRLLADLLAGYLSETQPDPVAAATRAGRAWGGYLVSKPPPFTRPDAADAVGRVVELLDDLGFSPRPDDGGGDGISLCACPFRDVARSHPDVACSVHLGLMQGAFAELGMPRLSPRLAPFSTPSSCHLEIAVGTSASGEGSTEKEVSPW